MEEKIVTDLFRSNHLLNKNKNILLYGTGLNTKTIVNNCEDFNILGLLDGTKSDEYLYGKYIYKLENILELEPEIIIVIARTATVKIITRRISDFCRKNNILLYDIYGNNLLAEKDVKIRENEYFSINIDSFKEEIDHHDVISFDIFDTLVMRRTLFPQDVFDIIAFKYNLPFEFKKERIRAEIQLMDSCVPTLEEIYNKLSENTRYDANYLAEKEFELEKKVIIRREKVVELLHYAVEKNKMVYLVSDMYLNKHQLNEILTDLNITGYNDIFVSSEFNTSKENELFEIYMKSVGGKNYLHIGDNSYIDGKCARDKGIDTCILKSAYEMTDISSLEDILNISDDINSKLHVGIFISNLFNDPFSLYNSNGLPHVYSSDDLGYFIAPIVVDFVGWLVNKMKSDNISNILLAARDGMLIKKIFDILNFDDLKYNYFVTSRSFSALCCVKNDEDIDYILRIPFGGNVEEMMKKRFLVDEKLIVPYEPDDNFDVKAYVRTYSNMIKQKSEDLRKNYYKYVSKIKAEISDNTAFFDFVSSGTSQMCTNKIFDVKLKGYYFIRIFDDYLEKQMLDIKSMQCQGYAYELDSNLYKKYIFLENIFTSEKPTMKTIDENGDIIYSDEYRTEDEISAVESIHSKILEYTDMFWSLCDKSAFNELSDTTDKILGLMNVKDIVFKNSVLDKFVLRDDFNGTYFETNAMLE